MSLEFILHVCNDTAEMRSSALETDLEPPKETFLEWLVT